MANPKVGDRVILESYGFRSTEVEAKECRVEKVGPLWFKVEGCNYQFNIADGFQKKTDYMDAYRVHFSVDEYQVYLEDKMARQELNIRLRDLRPGKLSIKAVKSLITALIESETTIK